MIVLQRLRAQNFKQLIEVSLHFPPQGSVLIEGLNEAGKSSLFEAIFFALYGEPLLAERDVRIEHLRSYKAEEMRVELDFRIEGRPFSITRRVGKNHTASLECPAGDGATETIRPLHAIADRLKQELRLSRAALLNTCFVEQKGLERLESLNAKERRDTINELLNLRVLTHLETEYRIQPKDTEGIRKLGHRVKLAHLDAVQPELAAQEHQARCCLTYIRLLECRATLDRLAAELQHLQAREETNQSRRAQIAADLEAVGRLRARIRDIEGALTLRVQAWTDALRQQHATSEEVLRLETLVRQIPEHEARLHTHEGLHQRLEALVQLEASAQQTGAALEEARRKHAARTELERKWQRGEDERGRLLEQSREAGAALTHATRNLETRRTATLRDGNLARLEQHGAVWQRAVREGEALLAQLQRAEREAATLESAQSRLGAFEAALDRRRQDKEDGRELERVESRLETCHGHRTAAAERTSRIRKLRVQLGQEEATLAAAREEADQAWQTLHEARLRAALLHWADAAERCAEADPHSGQQAELTAKQAAAQAEFYTARAREHTVGGQMRVAVAAAVLAGSLAVTGLVVPGMVAPGIGGLLVLIAAAAGASLLARLLAATRKMMAATRSVLDRLEGEVKAVETQARTAAARREEWAAQERQHRHTLQGLKVAIPPAPSAARSEAAALPHCTGAAAEERSQTAGTAASTAAAARQITAELLQAAEAQAASVDLPTLDTQIQLLQEEQARLVRRRAAAPAETSVLQEAAVLALGGPDRALEAAHNQVARGRAARESIAGLQDQRQHSADTARSAHTQAAELARQFALDGDDAHAWLGVARTERRAFRLERERVGDAELKAHEQSACDHLQAVRDSEARLDETQRGRRTELNRVSPEELAQGVTAREEAIAQNAAGQQPLHDVRPTLEASSLQTEPTTLLARLAAERRNLERDQQEAAKLPAARATLTQLTATVGAVHDQLGVYWKALLEAPIPQSPADAGSLLATAVAQARVELDMLNGAQLRDEDRNLAQQASDLTGKLATTHHQHADALQQETGILDHLSTLELSVEGHSDDIAARHPELAAAPARTLIEWGLAVKERADAVRANRSNRDAQAQTLGLGDEPLDREAEQQALAGAEKELAVRRRAGEIVTQTRAAIVARVMPLTMQNMQQLLPLLTDGRYQHAEWDEQENVLSVFDQRAGAPQRKRVFSGGARDQISLALRLAFALATLPGEHNVRPGWLFLDEPLSSFDHRRTQDLVDLLTRGLIRRQFPQVFLISHSQSFDPGQFDYRLRMEAGRVAESTLPTFGETAR